MKRKEERKPGERRGTERKKAADLQHIQSLERLLDQTTVHACQNSRKHVPLAGSDNPLPSFLLGCSKDRMREAESVIDRRG